LCLSGFVGLGTKATDESIDLFDTGLNFGRLGLLLCLTLCALLLSIGIITLIQHQLAVLEGQNAGANGVQKIAIMRNQHQRTLIAQQPALQPGHGIDIQVVGGFIQQQQVRWTHQCSGQIQAHAPATGKVIHGALFVATGEAQPGEQLGRACVCLPGAQLIQLVMGLGDSGRIMPGFSLRQSCLGLAQLYMAVQHIIQRHSSHRIDLLLHAGDLPVSRNA
jgi:hypothetical protein